MAVEFGDQFSGFRHSEVIHFINNEVLMNGGGPEFYVAFRYRSWKEIEDQLRKIVVDPQVPRSRKRSYAWSGLALGVRAIVRQRDQQTRRVRRLQKQVEERKVASKALATELRRLRAERDEAAAQLRFTQAAVQQAMDEREVLCGRLLQAERSAMEDSDPLFQRLLRGLRGEKYRCMSWALGEENQSESLDKGAQGKLSLNTPKPMSASLLHVSESSSPWNQAMQLHTQMPGSQPFTLNKPLPGEFTCSTTLPSPTSVESETAATTSRAMLAVASPRPTSQSCLTSSSVAVWPQEEKAPSWVKSCHGKVNPPNNQQDECYLGESRTHSLEKMSKKPQETGQRPSPKEDPVMNQGRASLGTVKSRSPKKSPERHQATPLGNSKNHVTKKPTKKHQSPRLKTKQVKKNQHQEKLAACNPAVNWPCSWCKTMNPPWRPVCYKCKNIYLPGENGGVDLGQKH
ncbi:PREDICTED: uncharacterized protein LOC105986939 [Dipodomys ordii]|uniref:Uncharacterized protein LOC105986939 n=1 Tax=Dipodomys ordii TaxID=10020 RepID=A0A1S3FBA1_DIPOR|nr:PREDICTED: uncharacterized protein LOC105986939 [Dipodomys ordii]